VDRNVPRLIAMGGTIAFHTTPDGARPYDCGADLLKAIGAGMDAVEVVDLFKGSSIGLTLVDLMSLLTCVYQARKCGRRGVVVTHGTDTLEETVYFLALTAPRDFPIVVTGAMRPEDAAAADGAQNLSDALATIDAPEAACAGPLAVMSGKIHAARFVSKFHATAGDAFHSAGGGIIGEIVETRPRFFFRPIFDDFVGTPSDSPLPNVETFLMTIGGSTKALSGLLAAGLDGLVVSGFGAGHVAPQHLDVLQDVVDAGTPVVVTSRCSHPMTLAETYGVAGTEIDLQKRGILMGGCLTTLKARLRLMIALACGVRPDTTFPVT